MSFNSYFAPLKKWWWLLAASAVIAVIASLFLSLLQPPVYMARSTLVVGNVLNAPNPNGGEYYLQLQLANIYADIANRGSVAAKTMVALNLTRLPSFTVRGVVNAPFLEIVVTDTNPTRAMVVANELANQILLNSPTNSPVDAESQQFISNQLDSLKKQIDDVTIELTRLQEKQKESTSARQIAELGDQILTSQNRLRELQNTYANFLANTSAGATNTLSILEKASLPTQPIFTNILMTVLSSIVVGLVLSSAGAYAIEFLDDSVKSIDDIKRIMNYPIVGFVPFIPKTENIWTHIIKNPRSPVSHSLRVLRTNLDMLDTDMPIRSILVSSAGSSEGKSTIAANLAITLAQSGRKVMCIDADLHRPMLHNAINYKNEHGLTDVLNGNLNFADVQIPWGSDRLVMIPTGDTSGNAAELLNSRNIDLLFDYVTADIDSVIIDSPPIFLAETSILCTKVDCVILVVRTGHTRKDAIKAVRDQLDILRIKHLVVVLNRVDPKDTYNNKYYSLYNYSSSSKTPKERKIGRFRIPTFRRDDNA